MNDDDAWLAHVDQLGAAARESKRRAIKSHVIARWVYAGALVINAAVVVIRLLYGYVAWVTVGAMGFIALMWVLSEQRLARIRKW